MSKQQWEDDEAIWRAAEREANNNKNNNSNNNNYYNEEEEEDEELLRNVPCANDAVSFVPPTADSYSSSPTPAAITNKASRSISTTTMEISKGICTLPPLSQTCFMMRGDNGVVRWLTASGLDKRQVLRKRGREETGMNIAEYPHQQEEIAEEDGDGNDNGEGEEEELLSVAQELSRRRTGTGLGYVSVPALLQQIYEGTADSHRKSQILTDEKNKQQQQQQEKKNSRGDDTLWVIKYSPKRFRDLLSDDSTNLKLLQWMKSWDAYIFDDNTTNDGSSTDVTTNIVSTGFVSAPKRPEERLAVLVGPPGVGKTTLAHVLAVHCGYEPIEINASVDRTTSALENAIQLAVAPAKPRRRVHPFSSSANKTTLAASSSLLSSSSTTTRTREEEEGRGGGISLVEMILRPKCLIIDEMDGIAANVAAFLLKQDIHCPVFCLCNDYYTPSLRPLRRQCQHVYHFQPIRPQRLLSRLGEIVQREGLNVSSTALAELVQSSNGDVRCCLNTLQFLYRHTSPGMTTMMHAMQGKDTELGLWETWRTVFVRQDRSKYIQMLRKEYGVDYEATVMAGIQQHTTTAKKAIMENSEKNPQQQKPEENEYVTQGFRVDPGYIYVSRAVQQCAESRTLLDGLQEYYLQRPYADYSLQRTSAMADAFSFHDYLSTCAYQNATASATLIPFVDQYAYTTASACFSCCGSTSARTAAPLGFPRESHTAIRQETESASIARTLRDGCRGPLAAHLCSIAVLAQEVAPLLLRCLCNASLRTPAHSIASLNALNREDQFLLQASIARHAEYGLTYARSSFHLAETGAATTTTSSLPSSSALTTLSFPGGGGAAAEEDVDVGNNGVVDEHWELTPPIHRIGCVSLHTIHRKHTKRVGFALGAQSNSGFAASSSFASPTASTSIMVLRMKEEMKQLMVGEIQRYIIQKKAAHSTITAARRSTDNNNINNRMNNKNEGILAALGGKKVDESGLPAAGRKREREGDEILENEGNKVKESVVSLENKGTTNMSHPISHLEPNITSNNSILPKSTVSSSSAPSNITNITNTTGKSKPSGKRDFFGRLIPESSTKTTLSSSSRRPAVGTAAVTAGGIVTGRTAAKLTVQYTYHDGCTNAVRIPASFEDF
ncbi:ATPase [Trypanosoma melophagium]|uniref:ATPase n=1 Tax=Trypanosoma melophagium TaxID=715481 RepID=UPI00351A0AC8|nr:ATPase [Trypanosoma melophagium]